MIKGAETIKGFDILATVFVVLAVVAFLFFSGNLNSILKMLFNLPKIIGWTIREILRKRRNRRAFLELERRRRERLKELRFKTNRKLLEEAGLYGGEIKKEAVKILTERMSENYFYLRRSK